MEREQRLQHYSIHQEAAEVAGRFSEKMGRAKTLAEIIANDLTQTRDRLLDEERVFGKTQLGYNLDMDTVAYRTLFKYKSFDPLDSLVYRKALEALNGYTHFQLETHLSERFNVLSSQYRLDIRNGEIWSDEMNEPFKNMLIRGKEYRAHHGSKEQEREQAEIDGFVGVTEPILLDPRVPVGTIVLSISSQGKPGSIYQHNYYDMFIVRQETNGKRFIEVRRYSSALAPQEYVPKVVELNPLYAIPDTVDDVSWLKSPVRIMHGEYNTPEKLHAFLHKEHAYMSEKEFPFIKNGVGPYKDVYTKILLENPYDYENQNLAYRAILNRADELWGMLSGKSGGYAAHDAQAAFSPTMYDIRLLGNQHVRQVMTGCGTSGDEDRQDMLKDPIEQMLEELFGSLFKVPFSVGEFGEETDSLGSREFNCPVCNYKNIRPYNQKIKLCQNENCADRTKVAC